MSEIEKGSQVAPTNSQTWEAIAREMEEDRDHRQRLLGAANNRIETLEIKVYRLERWRKAVLDLSAECAEASDGNCAWAARVRDLPLEES